MKSYFVLLSLFIGQLQCESLNFKDCGLRTSCMALPDGCTPSETSALVSDTACTVISWETGESGISMTVYGENTNNPGDWVGVGMSKTGGMETSDTYICKRLGEEIKLVSAYSAARGPPIEYPTELNDPSSNPGIAEGTIGTCQSGNSYSCTFVVNATVTKEGETFNYVEEGFYGNAGNYAFNILMARGTLSDWKTSYHSERVPSTEPIEFHPDETPSFIGGNPKLSPMVTTHAAMMFFAWALCAPIG